MFFFVGRQINGNCGLRVWVKDYATKMPFVLNIVNTLGSQNTEFYGQGEGCQYKDKKSIYRGITLCPVIRTPVRYIWIKKCCLKLSCDSRFQRAFTACSCVFKVIALVWANQRNFFENATTCSKRMRKTLVATQLKIVKWLFLSF